MTVNPVKCSWPRTLNSCRRHHTFLSVTPEAGQMYAHRHISISLRTFTGIIYYLALNLTIPIPNLNLSLTIKPRANIHGGFWGCEDQLKCPAYISSLTYQNFYLGTYYVANTRTHAHTKTHTLKWLVMANEIRGYTLHRRGKSVLTQLSLSVVMDGWAGFNQPCSSADTDFFYLLYHI